MKADIRAAIERDIRIARNVVQRERDPDIPAALDEYAAIGRVCDFAAQHAEPAPADTPELVEVVRRPVRIAFVLLTQEAPERWAAAVDDVVTAILSALRAAGQVVVPVKMLDSMSRAARQTAQLLPYGNYEFGVKSLNVLADKMDALASAQGEEQPAEEPSQ